jgi:hypothetical protein
MNTKASISSAFFLLSFFTFLLFSCKSNDPASLPEVLEAVSPAAQQNNIDPRKDNFIEGKKGTKVFIPANSLQFKDGSYPKGEVTIELKEFYSLTDFLSSNLSTVSNNFLLETGGMVHLAAFSEGKELQVDKEKSLAIAFPNKNASKEMDIFYGDTLATGQVNWRPFRGGSDASGGGEEFSDSTSLYENKVTVCTYQSGTGYDTIYWKLKHPDSTLFNYISKKFNPSDSILVNELCVKGFIAELYITLDKSGKVTKTDFSHGSLNSFNHVITPPSIRKPITDFFLSLPPIDMNSMANEVGKPIYLALCCHHTLNQDKFEQQFRKKYSQYRDKAVQKIDPDELNNYIFSASKLGWINCDRFLGDSTEKIDFIVKTGIATDAKVMIAFDTFNSIMQGEKRNGNFVFRNIPLNSRVRVIAVSFKDGKPLLSKMPATISKRDFVMSGFTEFSLKNLENELNKNSIR